jgi:SulP family sulfate permease
LDQQGVRVIGELPKGFPPLAKLPLLDLGLISQISTGALAVGAIALVQTVAITRSIAAQTGQRLDSNQEFVGQGLANIFSGLFSGYACSGSFSVTAVNFKAGAKTPFSSILTGLLILLALFTLGPVTTYLPRTVLAGTLVLTAYTMINYQEIGRIARGAPGDAVIMLATLLGTLFLKVEFAVLMGILLSFALYIIRTSIPRVKAVLPDNNFKHFTHQPNRKPCPQLNIIEIWGDLYFGAVSHIEDAILNYLDRSPEQRYLLIRMHHVNQCDFSGIHMLENIVRSCRERKGDVFFVRVNEPIIELMVSTGFIAYLGESRLLVEDDAISHLFHRVLDPTICIYECAVRAFKECQNLPKRVEFVNIPHYDDVPQNTVSDISPRTLWQQLHNGHHGKRPLVVDVREPREFKRGHIAEAQLIPLPTLLSDEIKLPNDRQIIFVCRSGRRSRRAAYALQHLGCMNVAILDGGMLAWEADELLEAVD